MSSSPRSPQEHYRDAERLLAAAESSRTEQIQTVDALIAIGHALLAAAPRRARKPEQRPARHTTSDLPRSVTWGDDERTDR
jgi:hypothetical protein